jgi:hypothetical protein
MDYEIEMNDKKSPTLKELEGKYQLLKELKYLTDKEVFEGVWDYDIREDEKVGQ